MSEQLLSGDARSRLTAAQGLAALGKASESAKPSLLVAVNDIDCSVRLTAAEALWRIDGSPEVALGVVEDVLQDADCGDQEGALTLAWRIGRPAAALATEITRLLNDPDWRIRNAAVSALGRIGQPAKAAVSTIRDMERGDPRRDVRRAAKRALYFIEPESGLEELASFLRSPDESLRLEAAIILTELGPVAAPTIPALLDALRDNRELSGKTEGISSGYTSQLARAQAAMALAAMGESARVALPALRGIAGNRNDDEGVRKAASKAIAIIEGAK